MGSQLEEIQKTAGCAKLGHIKTMPRGQIHQNPKWGKQVKEACFLQINYVDEEPIDFTNIN